MSGDLFRRTGEALYGSRWKPDLGGAIGMTDRNLRRYAAGSLEMSPSLCAILADICDERAAELVRIAGELRRTAAEADDNEVRG